MVLASIGRSWLTIKDAPPSPRGPDRAFQETKISTDLSSLSYNAFVLKHVLDVLGHSFAGADCYEFEAMSALWESDGRTAAYFEFRHGIKGMLPALRKPGDLDRAELFLRYSCFKDPISVLTVILQETRYRLPVRDLDLGALGAQPTRRRRLDFL